MGDEMSNRQRQELLELLDSSGFFPDNDEENYQVYSPPSSFVAAAAPSPRATSVKTPVVNLQSKLQNVLPRYANGNRKRFALMTLPELQAELRALMESTENAGKKEEIRLALQQSKGTKTVPVRQVSKPGSRWTMTKGSPRKARKGRKTRRSKHRK